MLIFQYFFICLCIKLYNSKNEFDDDAEALFGIFSIFLVFIILITQGIIFDFFSNKNLFRREK